MNTRLEIQPYVGVGPLKFGMTQEEVAKKLGKPDSIRDHGDEIRESREGHGLQVVYAKNGDGIVEIGFSSGIKSLQYDGIYVFQEKPLDVLKHITASGSKIYELLGFLVLLDIGITFTAFHNVDDNSEHEDNGEKAVTVFKLGRWDNLRDRLSEYNI